MIPQPGACTISETAVVGFKPVNLKNDAYNFFGQNPCNDHIISVSPKTLGTIFIGPRCPWSDLWVLVSLTHTPFADLTDVTLADEDTNSILIDNANRAIQGNVAMQVAPSGGKSCN